MTQKVHNAMIKISQGDDAMFKLLVADDERKIREAICDYMSAKGFCVSLADNGKAALDMAMNDEYDLIILDVMMPAMDGLSACREIREFSKVPILFLSALGEENDYLKAYKSGCDDYIVKPFPLSILCEKCRSMIARSKGLDRDSKISVGNICIDYASHKVYSNNDEISLAPKDFEILAYLMENNGRVLDRELILTRIWGYDFDGDTRVVDTHIKRIRKALGENASYIKTVSGVGYLIEEV